MLRRRIEGCLFGVVAVCLLPWLLLASACGAGRCLFARVSRAPLLRVWRSTSKRWFRIVVSGLDPLREVWRGEFECERAGVLWRYLVWIEVFNVLNMARGMLPQEHSRQRILVAKLAHIGDSLHVVPFLRGLREQRPDVRIELMVGPWCKTLAEQIPYANETIVYAPHLMSFNRGDQRSCRGVWSELALLFRLRRRRYDVFVSSSTTSLVELYLIFATCPRKWIGADPDMYLYESLSECATVPYKTKRYEADRVASLLPLVGCKPIKATLEYRVSEGGRVFVQQMMESRGIGPQDRMVLIGPGAGWPGKQWLPERFAALADIAVSEFGARVVLIGSAAERPLAERVARSMKCPSVIVAGETTLDQLAALIERSELFIGNDSGPMHLAAALDVPTLVFFGPTPPAQWAPRGLQHVHLAQYDRCDGCWYWHPRARCIHENRCMKAIELDDAARALREQLNALRNKVPGRHVTTGRKAITL